MSESNVKFTRAEAIDFHARGRPGKIEIVASKPMATQRDLSLAYSPGVAVPVEEIAADPGKAYDLTAKGNLVAVISNGTAILGLGNLGALALLRGGDERDREDGGGGNGDASVAQHPRRIAQVPCFTPSMIISTRRAGGRPLRMRAAAGG